MKIKYSHKFLLVLVLIFTLFSIADNLYAQHVDDASFVFARKLYNDKLYDLAAEQFHQFAEINFEHAKAPESLLMAGKCYIHTANYNEAKKEFIGLITKYPESKFLDEAQFLLAECFEKNNEFLSAAKSYRQVQVFYPKSSFAVTSLMKSAQTNQKLKEYESATENLYHIIEFYPRDKIVKEARLLLAEIFEEQKKYQQASLELDKLLAQTEKGRINASALYKKGHIERVSGHVQGAEDIFHNLIEKYQSSKESDIKNAVKKSYKNLADISRDKGFFRKSIDYLKNIQNYQKNNLYVFKIAENFYSLKDYSTAIEYYEIITNNNSDRTYQIESYFRLGKCFAFLHDYVNSTISFDHVIELSRDSLTINQKNLCKKAFINVSENYATTKNQNLAVKYLKDFLNTFADEPDRDLIVFRIGVLYEKDLEDIERAIRIYYDFIDDYPLSRLIDDAQFNLGNCFEKKNNYSQAISEYQQLINNFPASEYVSKAWERIEYIKNYFQTDSDVLNQFSSILKQLTATQEVLHSDFELGFIYFKELKDYSTAKKLFKKSYSGKKTNKIKVDKIIYYLGRSYQLLGEKQDIEKHLQQNYLDSAYYDFDILLENLPESEFADDAAFYQIKILEGKKNEIGDSLTVNMFKNKLTNFRYKYNKSEYVNNINLLLGDFLIKMGIKTAVDSMDIHHCYEDIINNSQNSSIINKAKFSLALFYYEIGETVQSENRLKGFLKTHPKSNFICEAYRLLAKIYENKGDYGNAVNYLKYIVQNFYYSKCSDETTLKIADLLKKQNKYSEADSYYQLLYGKIKSNNAFHINENNKNNYQTILFNLSNIALNKKNELEAISYLEEYILKFPIGLYADRVLFELGKLNNTNNSEKQKKAINYFRRIEHDFSSSALSDSALLQLGDIYFEMEDYERSLPYYAKILNEEHETDFHAFAYSQKIICLYRMGKTTHADNQFKLFKKKYKKEEHLLANILLEKGDYYIKTKKLNLAEKVFKGVRSDYKNSHDGAKAEYMLGKLNFILNKDEEALEIMSKLIERYPNDMILSDVYMTLGNFYYLKAKQIEHALLSYKKATEQTGIDEIKLKNALNNLIKCYSDLRLREQALAAIRKYLNKYPTANDVFEKKVLMGVLYYELKEFDVALNLLKKLKYEADIENEPRIQYWIGECYFGKGEFKRAVSEYLKVVYISKPTKLNWRVTAQYQAGIAYVKSGEPQRALGIFEKIIQEQGAGSVFGKPAQKKIDEISELVKKD